MKKGKLIVIEGTDCSGKKTQTELLVKKLRAEGISCENFSFPFYNSPTGKIIAGPYLAKPQYNIEGYFPEGAANVHSQVASLYFAADRKYNLEKITNLLNKGINVILDRYVESNMAHQAGKSKLMKEKKEIIKFLEILEFRLLKLPRPDLTVFLHMPTEVSVLLKQNREEKPDQHESDFNHLKNAEETYLYLAKKYGFKKIECSQNLKPRTIDSISADLFSIVKKFLNK